MAVSRMTDGGLVYAYGQDPPAEVKPEHRASWLGVVLHGERVTALLTYDFFDDRWKQPMKGSNNRQCRFFAVFGGMNSSLGETARERRRRRAESPSCDSLGWSESASAGPGTFRHTPQRPERP